MHKARTYRKMIRQTNWGLAVLEVREGIRLDLFRTLFLVCFCTSVCLSVCLSVRPLCLASYKCRSVVGATDLKLKKKKEKRKEKKRKGE
jgi:hypothetical protein